MAHHNIQFPEPPVYRVEIPVRITDLSSGIHLAFDKVVSIVNDASAHFFKDWGMERTSNLKESMIYTDLCVSYRSEAFFGDILVVDIAVGKVLKKGIDLVFRIRRKGQEKDIALAVISVLFFDYENHRAIEVPERILKRIKEK